MQQYGNAGPRRPWRRARQGPGLFERAYLGRFAGSCAELGGMLARGEGIEKDVARAVELYRMACRLDNSGACKEAKKLENP